MRRPIVFMQPAINIVQIHDAAHHPHACDHTVPGVANMIANIANCDQRVALLLLPPPLRNVSSCPNAETAATGIAKVAMGNVLSHAIQAGDQMRIAWANMTKSAKIINPGVL